MRVEKREGENGDKSTTYITFESIDYLNEYMTSPVRERLVKKVQPFLAAPTVIQLQKDRALPDSFTDLCLGQGKPVPKLLPKKWKVWVLTTMGLWFVVLISNEVLPTTLKHGDLTVLILGPNHLCSSSSIHL